MSLEFHNTKFSIQAVDIKSSMLWTIVLLYVWHVYCASAERCTNYDHKDLMSSLSAHGCEFQYFFFCSLTHAAPNYVLFALAHLSRLPDCLYVVLTVGHCFHCLLHTSDTLEQGGIWATIWNGWQPFFKKQFALEKPCFREICWALTTDSLVLVWGQIAKGWGMSAISRLDVRSHWYFLMKLD